MPRTAEVIAAVAKAWGFTPGHLTTHHVKRPPVRVAEARYIAIWILRRITALPVAQVGKALGYRDHTTVAHACRTVEVRMNTDPVLAVRVNAILYGLERARIDAEARELVEAIIPRVREQFLARIASGDAVGLIADLSRVGIGACPGGIPKKG